MITLNTEELTVEVPTSIYRVPLALKLRNTSQKLGDVTLMPPVNGRSHLYLHLEDQQMRSLYQTELLLGLSQYLFATQGIKEIRLHGFDHKLETLSFHDFLTPEDIHRAGKDVSQIEVVIVVLMTPQKQVLLGKRPVGKFMPGVWEFPGGKVEKGEGIMAAASRELYEELGIQIQDYQSFRTVEFNFKTFTLKGYFSVVTQWQGEPESYVHSELKWVPLYDLPSYAMPVSNLICLHDILTLAK